MNDARRRRWLGVGALLALLLPGAGRPLQAEGADWIDLCKDLAVWKKTIFILCYDENDGYFDHVPPFVAPEPDNPATGLATPGIDLTLEYHSREQDLQDLRELDA